MKNILVADISMDITVKVTMTTTNSITGKFSIDTNTFQSFKSVSNKLADELEKDASIVHVFIDTAHVGIFLVNNLIDELKERKLDTLTRKVIPALKTRH
jgi:hypothetical protein